MKFVHIFFVAVLVSNLSAQNEKKIKRAKPPQWKKNERSIFFENAFRDAIVGKPAPLKSASSQSSTKPNNVVKGENWSQYISSQTIEDEIKSLKILVDQAVTTERRFKSGNFKLARQHFSELAIFFGIVSSFDGDIRWKDQAIVARDVFSKSARNASVGTASVYRDAIARKNDLQDLVSGASLSADASGQNHKWSAFVERKPLMQRIKVSHEDRLLKWLSSKSEFQKHLPQIKKEAEILTAFSVILTKDDMEDANDDDYAEFCDTMRDSAMQLIKSVKDESFEQATKANGRITNACAECHDTYRG